MPENVVFSRIETACTVCYILVSACFFVKATLPNILAHSQEEPIEVLGKEFGTLHANWSTTLYREVFVHSIDQAFYFLSEDFQSI